MPSPKFPGQRCNAATGPEFNASNLNGFWLIRPDGSASPPFYYLQGLLNGSIPLPTPGPQTCTFVPNTDVQGVEGKEVQAATQEDCCAACWSDVQCVSGVFSGMGSQQCWLKYGEGQTVYKEGVTQCTKNTAAGLQRQAEPFPAPVRPFPHRAFGAGY